MLILSYENEFNLHVNENSFSYERMSTKTRFEKEAEGNSEMACYEQKINLKAAIFAKSPLLGHIIIIIITSTLLTFSDEFSHDFTKKN